MDMILAMRVYARVVERGSISQAAKDLHMGQSSVSETLTRLEKYLAVRLLMRNPRAITCTDYGMTFYNHSKIVLAAAAEAIRAVTLPGRYVCLRPAASAKRWCQNYWHCSMPPILC